MAARFCRALGKRLGVTCKVLTIQVPRRAGESLEAAAREARYSAIAGVLRAGEWMVTAHHRDDQLETLLLQLMRGAGVAGLASMSEISREPLAIFRPLLNVERDELSAWLQHQGETWIEDESNRDLRFDRNFLRHEIVPLLKSRWPAAARVATRSALHLGEAKTLLRDLASLDLAAVAIEHALDIAALQSLSIARQRNVLRHWLADRGLSMPDAAHLERVRYELTTARADAQPLVRWPGGEVRRYRGALYALHDARVTPPEAGRGSKSCVWHWRRQEKWPLGPGLGSLRWQDDPHGNVAAAKLPARLTVVQRHGGERLRVRSGGPRQSVKELLRVTGVLPWERERLPLLLDGDEVVAVGHLFVAAEYQYSGKQHRDDQRSGQQLRGSGRKGDRRLRLVWEDAPSVLAVGGSARGRGR